MNSDPLNQLWQQQPLPTARAYREISERSWEMRADIDPLDCLRPAAILSCAFAMLVGVELFTGTTQDSEYLLAQLPLALVGIALLIWTLNSWVQRRRLLRRVGGDLLRELEEGVLRVRQNQWFYRWFGRVFPVLFIGEGVWLFWPQARATNALTMGDWIWSGAFMLLWLVLAVVCGTSSRTRWREFATRLRELTALRDELIALNVPAAER